MCVFSSIIGGVIFAKKKRACGFAGPNSQCLVLWCLLPRSICLVFALTILIKFQNSIINRMQIIKSININSLHKGKGFFREKKEKQLLSTTLVLPTYPSISRALPLVKILLLLLSSQRELNHRLPHVIVVTVFSIIR